jgi:hypothetical protein
MTGNFWDFLIAGFTYIVNYVYNGLFPLHNNLGLAAAMGDTANTTIAVILLVTFSYVNLTVPVICTLVIALAEGTRVIYAIWRLILKVVPMAN